MLLKYPLLFSLNADRAPPLKANVGLLPRAMDKTSKPESENVMRYLAVWKALGSRPRCSSGNLAAVGGYRGLSVAERLSI